MYFAIPSSETKKNLKKQTNKQKKTKGGKGREKKRRENWYISIMQPSRGVIVVAYWHVGPEPLVIKKLANFWPFDLISRHLRSKKTNLPIYFITEIQFMRKKEETKCYMLLKNWLIRIRDDSIDFLLLNSLRIKVHTGFA